jgi:DNA-3-methyladenine glycosylase I
VRAWGRGNVEVGVRVWYLPGMAETGRRCWLGAPDPLMEAYHDIEWGVPVHDDRRHFEFLVLEGAQAGLSWRAVLQRREGYRRAFAGFDPEKVARFTAARIEKLLADPGIIRNRAKVASAVGNARAFLQVRREFGSFDAFVWSFVGGKPRVNSWRTLKQIPAKTPESEALSKELVRRGFRFVGPTIVYSHMQACGLVNDHLVGCSRHGELAARGGTGGRGRTR